MQTSQPFFRDAGTGPPVICLHANASSSGQWRALMDCLAPSFRVLAPDLYGVGKSSPRPTGRAFTLRDEVSLLEPLLRQAGERITLVGHSYGAAVALVAALAEPKRIRALALYEPTLFSLVDAESPPPNEADGIRETVSRAINAMAADDPDEAARCFIDFWMSPGAWDATPESHKGHIRSSMADLRHWASALMEDPIPIPIQSFAELEIPVLYMTGKHSPASSLSVARLLAAVLPRVQSVEFDDLGHMGPVTHPHIVNKAIASFLAAHASA